MDGSTAEPWEPRLDVDEPALLDIARELEAYAREAAPEVPPGLTGRILAAVGREPVPSPISNLARALSPAGWWDLPASLRSVARLAAGLGRPATVALRLQALAVLLAIALLGLGGGTIVVVGAQAVLHAVSGPPSQTAPLPGPSAAPTPVPTPAEAPASQEPGASASVPAQATPRESVMPPVPEESASPPPRATSPATPAAEPSETAEPPASENSPSVGPGATSEPGDTAEPTRSTASGAPEGDPTASSTPTSSATPSAGPGGDARASPSATPSPTPGGD